MDTSRNKITNIICVLFSITLALLFCFSIGIRFGIDNKVSRAIIAAVYCGIVVGLAFALNKVVNKAINKGMNFDADKVYSVTMVLDVVAFIVLRLLVISDIIKIDFVRSEIFDIAKINETNKLFVDFSTINNVFATILSGLFKVFGNTFFPVYLLQFVISCISFALILISVNKIFGRISSVFTGFVIAVSSLFYKNIASDSADNLIILMFAIILILTAKYKDVIEEKNINVFLSLLIGLLAGVFSLYTSVLVFAVTIPLVVLWNCRNEYLKDRIINTFVMIVGYAISFCSGLMIESYLIKNTGVVGFAESLTKHFEFRFSYSLNLNYLRAMADDTSIFLMMIIAIIYCVLYWKNEEDSANIVSLTFILFVLQLSGFGINNYNASSMMLALYLLIIGGCALANLGYEDSYRVYRIDDDMQPSFVQSIDDKPVVNSSKTTADNKIEETAKSEDPLKTDDIAKVEELVKEDLAAKGEESDNTEDSVAIVESTKENIMVKNDDFTEIAENVVVSNDVHPIVEQETSIVEESKYSEPESRKSSDYGINNADFESLFSGTSNLPKFVYNDIYTEDFDDDEFDSNQDDSDTVQEEFLVEDTVDTDQNDEENVNEAENNDTKDKKAYVDSFFGYLYGDDNAKFEAFEPIKPLDDIPEIKEEEPVKEEYVSHADKFADLDLDLGFDAFDNVIVETEPVVEATESVVEATESVVQAIEVAEENTEVVLETSEVTEISSEYVEKTSDFVEEVSDIIEETAEFIEEASDNSITSSGEDFSFEENIKTVLPDNEVVFFDSFSFDDGGVTDWEPINVDNNTDDVASINNVEDEIYKALSGFDGSDEEVSLEEILEKKIDEDFSYEDALSKKIENEELENEIGFSFEKALKKKLDVEESINNALQKEIFSYEEALSNKLIAEEAIEEAVNEGNISVVDTLSSKIKLEEIIDYHSEENDFSIQEAIETKIDVERSIENATNEKMLEEFGDDDLFEGVKIDFSGEELTETIVDFENNELTTEVEVKETLVDGKLEADAVVKEDITVKSEDENLSEPEEIKFIENPLPLPKKHVHREMDYGRVIPSAWMHYDVELDKNNNHYDI